MLLTEKSPPQKSASLCSTIGRELSLIYLIHSNNVLSLENPVGYLKAQYPALDDVAVDFANSSTFLLFILQLYQVNIFRKNIIYTFPFSHAKKTTYCSLFLKRYFLIVPYAA